eukprot:TRINITY_DN220_c0_g1_i1.p1 TRINITY_DN220_c0_g1~~TRINITY_DN220_c0_g1_i1.p1  ORF type:complete len:526 (+),score=44.49 TRINITY_DN220_c0_g1_i1:339-1916(+)
MTAAEEPVRKCCRRTIGESESRARQREVNAPPEPWSFSAKSAAATGDVRDLDLVVVLGQDRTSAGRYVNEFPSRMYKSIHYQMCFKVEAHVVVRSSIRVAFDDAGAFGDTSDHIYWSAMSYCPGSCSSCDGVRSSDTVGDESQVCSVQFTGVMCRPGPSAKPKHSIVVRFLAVPTELAELASGGHTVDGATEFILQTPPFELYAKKRADVNPYLPAEGAQTPSLGRLTSDGVKAALELLKCAAPPACGVSRSAEPPAAVSPLLSTPARVVTAPPVTPAPSAVSVATTARTTRRSRPPLTSSAGRSGREVEVSLASGATPIANSNASDRLEEASSLSTMSTPAPSSSVMRASAVKRPRTDDGVGIDVCSQAGNLPAGSTHLQHADPPTHRRLSLDVPLPPPAPVLPDVFASAAPPIIDDGAAPRSDTSLRFSETTSLRDRDGPVSRIFRGNGWATAGFLCSPVEGAERPPDCLPIGGDAYFSASSPHVSPRGSPTHGPVGLMFASTVPQDCDGGDAWLVGHTEMSR